MRQLAKLEARLAAGSAEDREVLKIIEGSKKFLFDLTDIATELMMEAWRRARELAAQDQLRLPFERVFFEFPMGANEARWVLLYQDDKGDIQHRYYALSGASVVVLSTHFSTEASEATYMGMIALGFLSVPRAVRYDYKPIVNAALAARRKRQGKAPLEYEHSVIGIDPTVTLLVSGHTAVSAGQKRASPCFHERRGHYRYVGTPREKWISATKVGDPKRGVTESTYRVAAAGVPVPFSGRWTAPVGQQLDNPPFRALSL